MTRMTLFLFKSDVTITRVFIILYSSFKTVVDSFNINIYGKLNH